MTYTWLDAMTILLREGMEALLVLVALVAFLDKSGNGEKQGWLWLGAIAGLGASVLAAFGLQAIFANLSHLTQNRDLIAGATGIIAAAMLFYVSYWLHSKSSLVAWQGYIKDQVSAAIAQESLFSLAFLAFLAVFREGAETVLFYLGIVPQIAPRDLWLGIAVALVLLGAIATLMLRLGLQIPIKSFFIFTSGLIYYLGFKFIGSGIHDLQKAQVLRTTVIGQMPTIKALGLYPTWETLIPQLIILAVAIALVIRSQLPAPETTAS